MHFSMTDDDQLSMIYYWNAIVSVSIRRNSGMIDRRNTASHPAKGQIACPDWDKSTPAKFKFNGARISHDQPKLILSFYGCKVMNVIHEIGTRLRDTRTL